MVRQNYVEKYAKIFVYLREHNLQRVDFGKLVKEHKVNAGLASAMVKAKLIERDKTTGIIKVLYHDSEPLHARRFLEFMTKYQKELKSTVKVSADKAADIDLLISRIRELLTSLDYEQLTDAQAKSVLLVESALKRF